MDISRIRNVKRMFMHSIIETPLQDLDLKKAKDFEAHGPLPCRMICAGIKKRPLRFGRDAHCYSRYYSGLRPITM